LASEGQPDSSRADSGQAGPRWPLLVLCVLVFSASLVAFTRNNSFPFYYHPSEPTKAGQLMEHEYNYLHPLLMLTSTQVSRKVLGVPDEHQAVVQVGRWVSAVYGSLAVALLLWIAGRLAGLAGGLCAAPFLALTPRLGELAHFMKEDPTLAMGVAAFLAALVSYGHRRTTGRLAFLALTTALACSAKYVGAVVLLVGLPAALLPRGEGRLASPGPRALIFLGVFLPLLAGLNYQVFRALPDLVAGVSHEVSHVTTGHYGFTHRVPHAAAFRALLGKTFAAPLAAVHLLWFFSAARRRSFAEWVVTAFGFALLLSFSSIVAGRYLLPAELTLNLLAGLGLARLLLLATAQAPRWRVPLAAGAAAGFAALLWPAFEEKAMEPFRHDTRKQLQAFVEETLPPNAFILQNRDVHLPTPGYWRHRGRDDFLDQEVSLVAPRGEFWSYEETLERGVTHVALRLSVYLPYIDKVDDELVEGFEEKFEQRRRFYQHVVDDGELLWESPPELAWGRLTPRLRLFRIATPPAAP
jgi:hypothetical protein